MLKWFASLACAALLAFAASTATADDVNEDAKEVMKTYAVNLTDVDCSDDAKICEALGKLAGVARVRFDCKTATIRMKPGASLTQEAVAKVISDNKWNMTEFKETSASMMITAFTFTVKGAKPAEYEAIAKAVKGELDGVRDLVIDADGFAVLFPSKGVTLAQEQIVEAFKHAAGVALSFFETKQWPPTLVVYSVSVPGMKTKEDSETVHDALAMLAKVLTVQMFPDKETALIRLNEPCDKIAENVTAALKAKKFEAKVTLIDPKAKAPAR